MRAGARAHAKRRYHVHTPAPSVRCAKDPKQHSLLSSSAAARKVLHIRQLLHIRQFVSPSSVAARARWLGYLRVRSRPQDGVAARGAVARVSGYATCMAACSPSVVLQAGTRSRDPAIPAGRERYGRRAPVRGSRRGAALLSCVAAAAGCFGGACSHARCTDALAAARLFGFRCYPSVAACSICYVVPRTRRTLADARTRSRSPKCWPAAGGRHSAPCSPLARHHPARRWSRFRRWICQRKKRSRLKDFLC